MDDLLRRDIEHYYNSAFYRGRNNILIYGEHERALALLKGMYDAAMQTEEFRCSWHDTSTIHQPMDFFEPILRLKYGNEEYESMREEPWFKNLVSRNELDGVFQLASLCVREESSKNLQARKLPVIFIDGIEELFFTMDYGHFDEEGRNKLLATLGGAFMDQPLPMGFGDCLRGYLHQTGDGIIHGVVRNSGGLEHAATLGNYHYLFYADNFMPCFTGEK